MAKNSHEYDKKNFKNERQYYGSPFLQFPIHLGKKYIPSTVRDDKGVWDLQNSVSTFDCI